MQVINFSTYRINSSGHLCFKPGGVGVSKTALTLKHKEGFIIKKFIYLNETVHNKMHRSFINKRQYYYITTRLLPYP